MADFSVSILARLIDKVTGPATEVGKAVKGLGERLNKAKEAAKGDFDIGADIKHAAEQVGSFAAKLQAASAGPIALAEEFEAQLSRVRAISGLSAAEMDSLRATALKLGADTSFSSLQVAQAMEYLGQAGFKAGQQTAALPGVLNLAAASGTGLAETADMMVGILGGFGKGAGDAVAVANLLASATTSSAVGLKDLSDAMSYAGPTATALGVPLEQVAAFAAVLGNAGIRGSRAGTGLNAMLSSLVNPRGEAKDAISALGLTTMTDKGQLRKPVDMLADIVAKTKTLGSGKQAKVIDAIFGREAMPVVLQLMKSGSVEISKIASDLAKSNEGVGSAAEMAAVMLDNAKGATEALGGSTEALSISLGTALLPAYKNVRLALASIIGGIAQWIDKHPTLTKVIMATLVAAGALAALLAGTLSIAATTFATIGTVKLIAGLVTTAAAGGGAATSLGAVAAALFAATWPIALVVAGLASLVGVTYYLWSRWDKLSGVVERFKNASLATKIVLVALMAPLIAIFSPIIALVAAGKLLLRAWEPVKAFFSSLWETIASGLNTLSKNPVFDYLVMRPAHAVAAAGYAIGATAVESAGVLFGNDTPTLPGPSNEAGKQEVGGTIKLQIDSTGKPRVDKLQSFGGIDLEVLSGMSMATP